MVYELTRDLEDQMLMQDAGKAEAIGKRVKRNVQWACAAWGLAVGAAVAGLFGPMGALVGILLSLASGWAGLRAALQEVEVLRVGF